MKHCSATGRRNYGRLLKRLLDTSERNKSTSGPTPLQIHVNDDDDDDEEEEEEEKEEEEITSYLNITII
jgi:hypothetical protein